MNITKNQIIILLVIALILAVAVTCLSKTFNPIILVLSILAIIVMIANFYLERKR